jgi:hypothetical protein
VRLFKKVVVGSWVLGFSLASSAAYNSNMQGVLKHVAIYADSDYIYIGLENQPASHPACKSTYFVISEEVPAERRQMLLSRLLMAYATKENVNIGYDGQGNCAHGYIRLHEVG